MIDAYYGVTVLWLSNNSHYAIIVLLHMQNFLRKEDFPYSGTQQHKIPKIRILNQSRLKLLSDLMRIPIIHSNNALEKHAKA